MIGDFEIKGQNGKWRKCVFGHGAKSPVAAADSSRVIVYSCRRCSAEDILLPRGPMKVCSVFQDDSHYLSSTPTQLVFSSFVIQATL